MQWNELSLEVQRKVLDRIGNLMLQEKDEFLQFAMASAMVELEMWSNEPVPEPRKSNLPLPMETRESKQFKEDLEQAWNAIDSDEVATKNDFVAIAKEPYSEN